MASLLVQAGADPCSMGIYDDDEIESLFPWLLNIGGGTAQHPGSGEEK